MTAIQSRMKHVWPHHDSNIYAGILGLGMSASGTLEGLGCAVMIRMARKSPVGRILRSNMHACDYLNYWVIIATRIEEIQVLKDLIVEMPGYMPMGAPRTLI